MSERFALKRGVGLKLVMVEKMGGLWYNSRIGLVLRGYILYIYFLEVFLCQS